MSVFDRSPLRLTVVAVSLGVAVLAGAVVAYNWTSRGDPFDPAHRLPVAAFDLPSLEEDATTGEPAYRLTDIDLRQGRTTLVNFWASWCGPCRVEHPHLMALAVEGIPIFGLAYKDTAPDARAVLEIEGNPYLRTGQDSFGRVGVAWGVVGPPATFVVDGDGRVVVKIEGPIDADTIDGVIRPAIAAASNLSPTQLPITRDFAATAGFERETAAGLR